jgi:serine/threonine-protein kinase PpkA
VELYRFGRLGKDALFYVMPLLVGGDLSLWLKPVPEQQVRKLLDQLLSALSLAHEAGIIHRDIKPENILFDGAKQRAQLADFGAIVVRGENRTTLEGHTLGSVGYMSPEQARGMTLTPASDLYSLAVVAFEMLTGVRPHDGSDVLAIALAQIETPAKPLPDRLAHWKGFFERALAPSLGARFTSAAAMQAALPVHAVPEAHAATVQLALVAPAALAPTQIIAPDKPVRAKSRSVRWLASAAFLLVLMSAGYWVFLQQTKAEYLRLQGVLLSAPLRANASELSAAMQLQQTSMLRSEDRAALARSLRMRYEQALLARSIDDATTLDLLREHQRLQQFDSTQPSSESWQRWQQAQTDILLPRLQRAIRRFDSTSAKQEIDKATLLRSSAPALRDAIAAAQKIPAPGEKYQDASGLELQLISAPTEAAAGLAIMTQPLLDADFQRYRAQLPATAAAKLAQCATAVSKVRGCVDFKLGQDITAWANGLLPSDAGREFLIPSAAQWQQASSAVPTLVNAYALSPSCHWITETAPAPAARKSSVVRRTWGGVRRIFSAQPTRESVTTKRCDGHLRYPLSGKAVAASLAPKGAVLTLVLVQRLRW